MKKHRRIHSFRKKRRRTGLLTSSPSREQTIKTQKRLYKIQTTKKSKISKNCLKRGQNTNPQEQNRWESNYRDVSHENQVIVFSAKARSLLKKNKTKVLDF